ncbi:MAG: cell division protein FtsQ/DivIB [Ignavibacteria bacterium]|nr:cell division protein FtsQ/DivIB [Ignavibacteria bacterium]
MKNWKLILLFVVVIIFAFSSIVLSGLWKDRSTIHNVILSGNITLSKDEIFDFAKLNDSIICSNVLSLDMIEARISKHPNIKKAVVLKDGTTIKIEIAEKNPFAAASNGKELFLVDDQLSLYSLKKEQTGIDLPVISGLSGELTTGSYGRDDLKYLKIAQFIISQSIKLNKSLYNYISEINFSDSSRITLVTSDDATPVYFIDYSNLLKKEKYETIGNVKDVNNISLRSAIDCKLVQLNAFLKQVRVYRPMNSFKYIDMRYNDIIVTKNNNQQ